MDKHTAKKIEKCRNWKKLGYKNSSQCLGSIRAKTQKAMTSSKAQLNKVEDDLSKAKNVRTKAKIKKNLSRSGY